jgi:opacity protein-like surface antigen
MKKSLAILLSTISLSSAAFANSFDGFYAGADVGGTLTKARLSGSVNSEVLSFSNVFALEMNALPSDLDQSSVIGDIHLGYGHQLGKTPVYIGAEVFGDFANRKMNTSKTNSEMNIFTPNTSFDTATLSTTIQSKLNTAEFGVDLHPGILLGQNTLLSAIVGVAFNKLQLNSNNVQTVVFNPIFSVPNTTNTLQASSSKNVAALRLGGELEQHFGNHWSLRAEYIYTDYGKISASAQGTVAPLAGAPVPTPNAFNTNINTNVTSNTVMLGLNYYFCGNQAA